MNANLPDVARDDNASARIALDWVGMQDIDIPIDIGSPNAARPVSAKADLQVDLPQVETKGIHMSRLYRLLNDFAQSHQVTPSSLSRLLSDMVTSHADCGATRSQVSLRFALLLRAPALVTPGLHGWKSYPVSIDGALADGVVSLTLGVGIIYSSTCPCSAALARQIVANEFVSQFGHQHSVPTSAVIDWLSKHATTATPHSQRSLAQVSVRISAQADAFGIEALITAVEAALSTAVQAAVKRADEQAFAALNGKNPMYVEDAARKIAAGLNRDYPQMSVRVVHMESLHPHDAIASVSTLNAA
ncbi:GTP cyclohydrolase FolE2 [Herbaspirillum sp. alder98]|uniref:GTP cyclohydrolase FolE2 n=1 Tax=Herbaspirillum sp. alder98 TaxID=2913096 RepID=UPI001CD8D952|nr:GTP cyclohydrolase FolE2 [Herbaspirillum sp. alder98]MCA1324731.1 GTP cyclohydrolase FolE2 [Herbaspirillum sp. alder98]